jgi:phosphatidylinositol-3-phosphatase
VSLGLTLPSPRVCVLLVLVFLGFGVIIGDVTGSRVEDTSASARPRLKLILPVASAISAASPTSAGEPPAAVSESTPTPTPALTATHTPAPTKRSSSSPAPTKTAASERGSAPSSNGAGRGSSRSPSTGATSKLPPVKHVFVIMLSAQPYAAAFGPSSAAPYLAGTLERKGELLVRYYAVAHEQLANGIALVSGQGPTPQTAQNCPNYTALAPGTIGAEGQVAGQSGCVYPSLTQTLAGELTAKRLTWKAYVEGMDEAGAAQGSAGACAHPALGAADPTSAPTPPAGQPYATFRNPFVYFQALTGSPACARDDVGLGALAGDLKRPKSTPSFAYIVPDRCHDGDPIPCASGMPAGMGPADELLRRVVPEILGSKGYKEGGLLVITTDEAPSSGELADSSSCCGQPRFPNLPTAGTPGAGLPARGGGEVGALLVSPFVKPHTTNQEPYNHFSLLRTIEDLFGLEHLGYAASPGVNSFEPAVFSAYAPG